MFNSIFRNEKALCFLGGAAFAAFGVKMLKSKTARKLCVNGLAHGMRFQKDALEAFQNMKEEAADICFDAKTQAGASE